MLDCYDVILDYYRESSRNPTNRSELQVNVYLMNLIQEASKCQNNLLTKNCLILLLNLFIIVPPDLYHEQGKLLVELTKKEKKELLRLLKFEI